MSCKHGRLRTVGFEWFCADCGKHLDPAEIFGTPADQDEGKAAPYPEAEPEENATGEPAPEEAAPADQEQAGKTPSEAQTGKSPGKPATAKKGRKKAE